MESITTFQIMGKGVLGDLTPTDMINHKGIIGCFTYILANGQVLSGIRYVDNTHEFEESVPSLKEKGLYMMEVDGECFICGNKTQYCDIDFECALHHPCHEIMVEGYMIAEQFGTNSKEYREYRKRYGIQN